MATGRLSVRKIRELLRLRMGERRSLRETATSVGVSSSTVHDTVIRVGAAGLSWPLDPELDDEALNHRLFAPPGRPSRDKVQPDMKYIHKEKRRKGVTLSLLWQEYKREHPSDGLQYSQFCEYYRCFRKTLDVSMRQEHKAGEKMFVDWSGDGIEIVNPDTGEVTECELFVAVLGASNYTYVRAFESQELRCWIKGHLFAYEYFGGVTAIVVPDNTKTAVTSPCRYDPDINKTYEEMAVHYDTAVIPARSYRPKDKAKVENGVLVAQRWILAALRNHSFFSVEQANDAIAEKLEELNGRKFQKLDTCRRELFETIERSALRPLPSTCYEFADWSTPRVNIDYHVVVDKNYYSVPYTFAGKKLEARRTSSIVEIIFNGRRVASHPRIYAIGQYSTKTEHMPKSHQEYLEWTPTRILNWAEKSGAATKQLASSIMGAKRHPEQGYKACLGILRLGKAYGNERLEAACKRALHIGSPSYRTVKSILKKGLDRQELDPNIGEAPPTLPFHVNVRGSDYYH